MAGSRESELNLVPQVCIAVIPLFLPAGILSTFLDDPAATNDISLPATARTIPAAITT